jgi:general secretion pathway protein M
VALAIGLPWYQRMTDLDAQIEGAADQIGRYQRLLASIPRLRAELERERNNEEVKAYYFDAPTEALAGAQLQSTVQGMVQNAGAKIINSQFLPAEAKDQPPRVGLRAQIQGDTNALLDILYDIEQARPFLFVDQLSVRSTTRRDRRQNRKDPQPQVQQELTIRIDVFGYALGGT